MSRQSRHNALADQTSPYLLQHADNPVDWYPWSQQALTLARQQNKPILLSIGYSACHWCHVMAHESFEDPATASLMNQHFVNIKVDREERPDLDSIYQQAQYLLTQRSGGWPLTVFLTPDDQLPFFAGTYFPKHSRFGLPAFTELLQRIADFYASREHDIRQQNANFKATLDRLQDTGTAESTLTERPLQLSFQQSQESFDADYGGFGQAPKFPHPTTIERLLLHAYCNDSAQQRQAALNMALSTLERMARGGIYDHIGGGFSRYSVDRYWMIPHFEKMLYDNGPLLSLYVQAWQINGSELFQSVAIETANWVIREMQSPEGGYYSSLDADSEGEEGKYYVWTPEQLQAHLSKDEYRYFAYQYGLDQKANFEGQWHLFLAHTETETAAQFQLAADHYRNTLQSIKARLLSAREQRVRPGLDDKILGAWNGLMIKGMAEAGQILQQAQYLDSATSALDFVIDRLWREQRLYASYKDGKAHLNAYLDDYAYLLDATLQLLQSHWSQRYAQFAIDLADGLIERFYDPAEGGFFFTSHDHETLILRNKPFADDATASGNGIACRSLLRLGRLLGRQDYIDAAEQTLKAAWPSLLRAASAHNALLQALDEYLRPGMSIIIRGEQAECATWRRSIVASGYLGATQVYAIANNISELPGLLAETRATDSTSAYLCTGHSCQAAEKDRQTLLSRLKPMVLK